MLSSTRNIYGVLEGFMKQHSTLVIFAYIFALTWIAFFAWKAIGEIKYGTEAMGKLYVFIGSLPIMGILIFRGYLVERGRSVFWKEFALRNGYTYSSTLDLSKEAGIMFKQGNAGRSVRHVLSGILDGKEARIFHYMFKIKAGKYTTSYTYTVFCLKFQGQFPHFYLNRSGNAYGVSIGEHISLPSAFEEKFKLYAPREYEIEALQIFTPDVLEHLLEIDYKYDVELVDNELLIFIDGEIDSSDKLQKEFNNAKKMRDYLAPNLDRMKFSPIGDRPYYLIK